MVTVAPEVSKAIVGLKWPAGTSSPRRFLGLGMRFRAIVLGLTVIFFLTPIFASIRYSVVGDHNSLTLSAYGAIFSDPQFFASLLISLKIALGTVFITIALVTPTVIWARLRRPEFITTLEAISLLPMIVPAVVVALGVLNAFSSLPNFIMGSPVILILEYVVLALPYTFRAIDSGVGSIDLKTLVEASRSLGAGWFSALKSVVLPNLRSAIISAVFLCSAFVFGEFAVASLMSFTTFPVWLVQVGAARADESVALSVVALVLTWAALTLVSIVGFKRYKRNGVLGGFSFISRNTTNTTNTTREPN